MTAYFFCSILIATTSLFCSPLEKLEETPSRRLGFFESLAVLSHDELCGTGNICTTAHIQGKIDQQVLLKALQLSYNRHPLLRATIKKKPEAYYFELNSPFSNVPVRFVQRESADQWEKTTEAELMQIFPTHHHLWNMTLIHDEQGNNELIFSFHHSIADGISCVRLVNELLLNYSQLIKQEAIQRDQATSLAFIDCTEKQLAKPSTWEEMQARQTEGEPIKLTSFPYQNLHPLSKRKTKTLYRTIDSDFFLKLKAKCHTEKVTVNSALNACMLLAAQKIAGEEITTSCWTPVNLRKYCNPLIGVDHFGCHITVVPIIFLGLTQDTDFWKFAKTYQTQLYDAIPRYGFFPGSFDLRELRKTLPHIDSHSASDLKDFSAGFCVTNLGNHALPQFYGSLQLKGVYFSINRQAGDLVFSLATTSFHDKLFCSFIYTSPLINSEWAEAFIEKFFFTLETAIDLFQN